MIKQLSGRGRWRWAAVAGAAVLAVGVATATGAVADTPAPSDAPSATVESVQRALAAGSIPLPGLARLTSPQAAKVLTGTAGPQARTRSAAAGADDQPPTTEQCRTLYGAGCYSGAQLATAYGVNALHRRGITGAGQTILFPIPWGVSGAEQRIRADLTRFSTANHLPAPRIVVQQHGSGTIPPMPPPDADPAEVGETYGTYMELALDLSAAHTIAPDAKLVILETTEGLGAGLTGLPPVFDGMLAYSRRHPGTIASMSYGTIADKPGIDPALAAGMRTLSDVLHQLTRNGSMLTIGNGDWGVTDGETTDRATAFPSSSPYAVTVGGTEVALDEQGHRVVAPDIVWGDRFGVGVATGAGVSSVFARPRYQDRYAAIVGEGRSETDFALNGASNSRLVIRTTFHIGRAGTGDNPVWVPVGGTSLSGPLGAGMLALVGQLAHHPLGDIHDELYQFLANPRRATAAGWDDVTAGCNSITVPEPGVPGYCAGPGFDIASGLGTVGNAAEFVPRFAATLRH